MFSFRTTPLDRQEDLVLRRGSLAVLCNQSAWDPERQEYLFESLYRNGRLRKVLFPADGIFGEKPDRSLGEAPVYASLGLDDCLFVPLHTGPSGELSMDAGVLEDVDALIVEYQDTGSRYDSLTALLYEIFQLIHHGGLSLSVYILDRENICGRWVEGTTLCPGSSEAAGIEGIPHRHGLTLGELANLFYSEIGARFPLHIISYMVRPATQYLMPWSIPPRQDVPGLFTSNFYCGMVLLSGTDLSFGEGTARPYELFGAPYMDRYLREGNDLGGLSDTGVFLRRTVFSPRFGRWKDRSCYGFQMLPPSRRSLSFGGPCPAYHAPACGGRDRSGYLGTSGSARRRGHDRLCHRRHFLERAFRAYQGRGTEVDPQGPPLYALRRPADEGEKSRSLNMTRKNLGVREIIHTFAVRI